MTVTVSSRATNRWRLGALALAMLLPSLGISIANVALPSLAEGFGADFAQVQWVVVSYLLAVTTLIVGAGRLGDMFGRRRMLLGGMAIFTIASVACSVAPSLSLLLAARAIQGAGAALMMSLTIAAVADALPKDQMGRAIGLLGTVSAVGTALGPSLGGVLIAWAGWPAVFAVVAAVGAVSFVMGLRFFERGAPPTGQKQSFDVSGFALLVIALGGYSLSMTAAVAPLVGAAVAMLALALFIAVELRVPAPLVSLASLADRTLGGSLVSLALVTTIVMATLVVGPFYLTGGAGLNAAQAGLVMSIGPTVSALVGVPAGRLVDRRGARPAMLAGLGSTMGGCMLMVLLPGALGVPGYGAALIFITAGYALFQAANNTAVMHKVPADRRGVVSALLGLSRNLGLVTGASAMGAVFALASNGLPVLGLPAGGLTGLEATFALGALLSGTSLCLILTGRAGQGDQ